MSILLLPCKTCLKFQYPVFVKSFKWTLNMVPTSHLNHFVIKLILTLMLTRLEQEVSFKSEHRSSKRNILRTLKVDPVSRLIIRVQVWSRLWEAETRGSEGSVPPAPAHRQHMSGQSQSDMMSFLEENDKISYASDVCMNAIFGFLNLINVLTIQRICHVCSCDPGKLLFVETWIIFL